MENENLYTFENPDYRKTYWHSCSHIMAQAVKRLWPEVQLAIGPAIEEGWYYDFDAPFSFTADHLTKIEAEMKKICKERIRIERSEKPRAEAIAYMQEKNEPYKVELIEDLPEEATISFYTQGEFTDLCAGPHLDHTGRVKHTFENPDYRKTYWHSCSHIMAQAVKRLWPEVQLAIGPAIEEGWYYDFDAPFSFTADHLTKIEAEMKKICKERIRIERSEKPRAEAIAYMQEKNEPYKVELIEDLPEEATISFYTQGEFTDLCAGPHLDHTGRVKHNGFKLTKAGGGHHLLLHPGRVHRPVRRPPPGPHRPGQA